MSGLLLNQWLGEQRDWLNVIKLWEHNEAPAWNLNTLTGYRHWLWSTLRHSLTTHLAEAIELGYPVRAGELRKLLAEVNRLAPPEEEDNDE